MSDKQYPADKNKSIVMDGKTLKNWADGSKRQSDSKSKKSSESSVPKDGHLEHDLQTFNRVRDALKWRETYDPDRDGNPPGFVTDEGLWDKAKDAAEQAGADDVYAFANWWYHEHS